MDVPNRLLTIEVHVVDVQATPSELNNAPFSIIVVEP